MIWADLLEKLKDVKFTDEVCIQIKTNITSGGQKIDFLYEIDDINIIMQICDNSIIGISGSLLKQNMRAI